jgi:hypothetical protein
MDDLERLLNMLAAIGSNANNVDAAIVAFRFKQKEGEEKPDVQILTLGDDAISIFGMSDMVKMELYDRLSKQGDEQ